MITHRQMWNGGPPRQWSETRVKGWCAYSAGGYAGKYVCSNCGDPVLGIYFCDAKGRIPRPAKSWLCGPCKQKLRDKVSQPGHLRKGKR